MEGAVSLQPFFGAVMKYLVTAEEMRSYDKNTIEVIGIPGLVLMERAALACFDVLGEKGLIRKGERAFVLAGVGNNGGDGLALARLLCVAGMETEILVIGNREKATPSWQAQAGILEHYPVDFCNQPSRESYIVIVDALFGVGLSRPVEGEYACALELAQGLKGTKVSLDVPSGLGSDDGRVLGKAFQADMTVTFGFEKRGLYLYPGAEYAGEVHLREIGIDQTAFLGKKPEMFYLDEPAKELLPRRKKSGNKGTFGKALIIAGSEKMAGALILCARAAYASGAGMVKTLTTPDNRELIQQTLPEALFGSAAEPREVEESLAWCNVIGIGPGLGQSEGAKEVFLKALTGSVSPMVIDADALNLLAKYPEVSEEVKRQSQSGRVMIMTPHLGELKRVYQSLYCEEGEDFWEELRVRPWIYARAVADAFRATVVAKDARSCILSAEREEICLNVSGNSGMATAGSGDVLAGILTALLCQGLGPFEAACRGARLHGLAGDYAAGKVGEHGLLAGDLIEAIKAMGAGGNEL